MLAAVWGSKKEPWHWGDAHPDNLKLEQTRLSSEISLKCLFFPEPKTFYFLTGEEWITDLCPGRRSRAICVSTVEIGSKHLHLGVSENRGP